MTRHPAGDTDYEPLGRGYSSIRRPDPRIGARVLAALGDGHSVINVGAGAGAYEPGDRYVVAVEPSRSMRAQRPGMRAPAIDATAEALPFDDDTFDSAMALATVHQWRDPDRGLRELRRVSRGRVVVLTFDHLAMQRFWLAEYAPDLITAERRRLPDLDHMAAVLGGRVEVSTVEIPADCTDGFVEAFYGRPEQLLDPAVRAAQSGWGFIGPQATARAVRSLRRGLEDGSWDRRHGHLRHRPAFAGSLRLLVAHG
ncbi:class I SAM-dependent methyltransferase [Pseudonocardia sp. HH130630-07]|uniref:class I SAM-dependent methyltransferase n=1 Tax=Pseudonocardia sp. HH130630-07 TaxID=1690815 RepID=UPI000814D04F|nr:methyltransferase domain-containing protein [Pseudonocardia sp. HH130630-07]ANY09619.1 ubiquinone biosynthesis protein [Pseudonocardia sp. HH130630-07]